MNSSNQSASPQASAQASAKPGATNSAAYYLMKNGFILRLEQPLETGDIPVLIRANLYDQDQLVKLNQDQANYRVAIFRDEILELDEYTERVYGQSY